MQSKHIGSLNVVWTLYTIKILIKKNPNTYFSYT
jgi:hypothetical protein